LVEFYELIESIEDSIIKVLKEARLSVENINWGDRARIGQLRPPLIWLFLSDARPSYTGRSELWAFNFDVVGIVENTDPYEGWREANKLGGQAASALVKSRAPVSGEVKWAGQARWVKRVGYRPAYMRVPQKQLHAVAFSMEVEFLFREP
jgi:hypothetical protein